MDFARRLTQNTYFCTAQFRRGSPELDFNSHRAGTGEKTKYHSLEVREQGKSYVNIDISKIDYQIAREGLRFLKKGSTLRQVFEGPIHEVQYC